MQGVLKLINNFLKKKGRGCLKNNPKNQLTDYVGIFAKEHRVQLDGVNFLLKLRPTSDTSYTTKKLKWRNFARSSVLQIHASKSTFACIYGTRCIVGM